MHFGDIILVYFESYDNFISGNFTLASVPRDRSLVVYCCIGVGIGFV